MRPTLVDMETRTVAKKKKWMQDAFANAHGQFRAKAERAGKSTEEYAREVLAPGSHASTHTKRQAALAERGMEAHHRRKRKGLYSEESRRKMNG